MLDTHVVANHYRNRPLHMSGMHMGKWFCNALDIAYPALEHAHSIDETKTILIERQMLQDVDPAIFILFNQLR